jgi:hypothetical protein
MVFAALFARVSGAAAQTSIPQELPRLTYILALLTEEKLDWEGRPILATRKDNISDRLLRSSAVTS